MSRGLQMSIQMASSNQSAAILTNFYRHPHHIQSASSWHPWMPTGCRPDVGGAARLGVVMSTNYRLKLNFIRLSFVIRGHDETLAGRPSSIGSASGRHPWMPSGCRVDADWMPSKFYIYRLTFTRHPVGIQSASSRHPWMPGGCRPDVGGAARLGVVMSTNYKLKRNFIRL